MSHTRAGKFDALTTASVAEMLHEMAKTLERLRGCAYLSEMQDEHVSAAQLHIDEAVAEWIDDVTSETPSSQRRHAAESATPEHAERGLECILDMLAIYQDDINERDFTPLQYQRIMIAAHNLLMAALD